MNRSIRKNTAHLRDTARLTLIMLAPALALLTVVKIVIHEMPRSLFALNALALLLTSFGAAEFSRGKAARAVVGFATVMAVIAVLVLEAATFYIQGVGFNELFFAYISLPGAHKGANAYAMQLMLVAAALFLAVAWIASCLKRAADIQAPVRSLWLAGLPVIFLGLALSPTSRLLSSYLDYRGLSGATDTGDESKLVTKDDISSKAGKNLVFVYLESFDSIYLDESLFPELTPNLSRMAADGRTYPGMRSYPGIGYTMSGLFSSQCGIPFALGRGDKFSRLSNNISSAQFRPDLVCLGDVLAAADYRQVFMGGADNDFAGKGVFFTSHGYQEVLGMREWRAAGEAEQHVGPWGLYDDRLFELAANKFDELSASGKPFNLSLLSVDTHGPDGKASPSCQPYARDRNTMLQAVHCSDQLVGKLVAHVQASPNASDTAIVIMGDHGSMRNLAHKYHPRGYHRAPALIVLNTGRGRHEPTMYHMDVAPTLLALLGVETNANFEAGWVQDDSSTRRGRVLDESVEERRALANALYRTPASRSFCSGPALIAWNEAGAVTVGERTVRLRENGYAVHSIAPGKAGFVDVSDASISYFVDVPDLKISPDPGGLVFRILPDESTRTYTVTATAGNGHETTIAETVPRIASLSLNSASCDALEKQLRSGVTTTEAVVLDGPGLAVNAPPNTVTAVTSEAPPEWFGTGWGTPNSGGGMGGGRSVNS